MLSKLPKVSKKKYFLRKKTKRENFKTIKIIDTPQTKITLVYISKTPYNFDDYSYIKFSFSDKINLADLIQNKVKSLFFNINKDKIYIFDRVELGNKDESKKEYFIIPIYLKKENTWYINLKPKIKGYFFEFIFYSNSKERLPEYLIYTDTQNLKYFDDYGLEYRKKMCIINVEEDFSKDYINNISLVSNSYKICARIKDNGKMLSSIHELKLEKQIIFQISSLEANTSHVKRIFNIFDKFKKNKSMEILKNENEDLDDDRALKEFLKKYIYVKKSYKEIPFINDNEVNLMKEYILKLVLKYLFINVDEKETKQEKKEYNNMRKTLINKIIQIINDIEKFANNKKDSLILKYRLYRATLYNLYSLIKKNSSNKFACLKILSEYNQKIIDINSSSRANPYYKAIKFLEKVADNLNEKSSLFDVLLQYNSGISDDINLFKTKDNEINISNEKYELSMLTVKEVIKHLKDILPSFIIRYTADKNIYAYYSCLNDVIFLNEKKTFKKNNLINLEGLNKYTLPLVILLIHECWGHKKVLWSNDTERESPIRNYLMSQNFDEEEISISNEKTDEKKGESGFLIEYIITGKKYNNIFSRYLLSNEDKNNEKLLDVKLWVQPDFEEFQLLMAKNIQELNDDDNETLFDKNRKEEENEDDRKTTFEVYYEDDVEIGILFKP